MNYYDRITSLLLGEARKPTPEEARKATPEAVERAQRHHAARREAEQRPINAGDNLPPPRALSDRERRQQEVDDGLYNYTYTQRMQAAKAKREKRAKREKPKT